jgi:hypothetical protein
LITSPAYPWNTGRSGYSLEDHGDTMSGPNNSNNNSNPNASLLRTPYVSFLSEGQPAQDVDPHENSTEPYRSIPEQQIPSQARAAAEKSVSQAPYSGYRSASLDNALFDTEWWNTAPAINVWDYPLSLVDMPSRDPMP